MSIPNKRKLWSVLTYDLRTALDVCGLPCLVKTPSRVTSDYVLLPLATKIKIETENVIYTAHVRVIDYDDSDWIICSKGRDFYEDRRQYIGCELLIPLSYQGLVRLYQSKKRKTYFTISEVAQDFPRLVRVEKDVACVSPGETKVQVVRKGTLLQLDRLTKSTQKIRGMSETYLMMFEVGTGKEYGFQLLCSVHFTEVVDTFKYTLKEVIDQLTLPRTVQFVGINPYDIIVADDEEAHDLLTIFDGPFEIVGIRRLEIFAGLYKGYETERVEIVAIPKDESLLDSILIHIPNSCLVDNDKTFADRVIPDNINLDLFQNNFFVFYVDDIVPAFLKNDITVYEYNFVDTSTAPPLPPRRYDYPSLTTAQSAPQINDADGYNISRKRFRSLGDITGFGNTKEESAEGIGFRGFFRSLSKRLNRRASQLDAVSSNDLAGNTVLNHTDTFKPRFKSKKHNDNKPLETFVCYLNCSKELSADNDFVNEPLRRVGQNGTEQQQSKHERSKTARRIQETDKTGLIHLDESVKSDAVRYKTDNAINEIIYASINWESKNYGVIQVRERFCCDICKTNFLVYNGNKRETGALDSLSHEPAFEKKTESKS